MGSLAMASSGSTGWSGKKYELSKTCRSDDELVAAERAEEGRAAADASPDDEEIARQAEELEAHLGFTTSRTYSLTGNPPSSFAVTNICPVDSRGVSSMVA